MDTVPSAGASGARRDLAALAIIAAAFAHCAIVGWRRWGDLLIDTGRELELPRRMLEGETLYSELRWYYGPLAPHVNAFLYRAFGVRVEVLAAAGVVSAALVTLALWLLTRRAAGRFAATIVALTFVYACAFSAASGTGIFNFALPYTFAATYGLVTATWSVYFLVRHLEGCRSADLYASVTLLALTAFTKIEVAAPLAGAHAVFALVAALRRQKVLALLAPYSAAFVIVGVLYAVLFARIGSRLWSSNLAGVWNDASSTFIQFMMGLDRPVTNLAWVVGTALLVVAWTVVGARMSVRVRWGELPPFARVGLVAAFAGASVSLALVFPWDFPFRASTVIAVAAVFHFGRRVASARGEEQLRLLARLVPWIFAAGCLLRVFLRPTPIFYGFYLLAPTIACAGIVLLSDLPARAAGWPRRAIIAQGAGLLLGGALPVFLDSLPVYAERSYEIDTPRGRWRTQYADLPGVVRALSELPPEARVLVVPEGAALNFFAARRGPDSMFSYLPMEMARPDDEDRVVASWVSRPPDRIVLLSLRNDEFGAGWFGIDYGRRCGEWIERNYRPVSAPARGITIAARASWTQ